jgi:small subunit ribosomal protein S1
VDGLVHVSELSWKHIDHPSEVVQVGDEVTVEVLDVDMDRERVSLSLKATQEDPWRHFARTHAIGQIVPGKVTKLVPFGAFVRVEEGIEGLVHISELAEQHVEVLDVDMDRERVSLSLKATQEDPWQQIARTHQIGQVVPGKVTKLVPFGAFVRVDEGIEGLVHISELAERHVELPEQVVQVGSDIFVKVIDIDLDRRRISLSLKQASEGVTLADDEHFDPALYGMAATYDEQGNYVYPEGFDPESGEWLPGHEAAQAAWEKDYAEAHARWEAHRAQVREARKADQAAALEAGEVPANYSSDTPDSTGTLASDEALQALRDKLTGD